MALNDQQIQSIYTARPDLQTYYAKGDPKNKGTTSTWGINNWWNKIGSKESPGLIGGTGATQATPMIPGTNYPAFQGQSQTPAFNAPTYNFDPNSVLPGIQQQATSIYQPQIQALESLRQANTGVAETAKITSEKDFQKQLQSEVESINSRGAFFSGGAANYTTGLQEQHQRDISTAALQAQGADFKNIALQAGLSAEQTQYITNQLYSAQGSAYQRYQDAYSNAFNMYQSQVGQNQFNQQQAQSNYQFGVSTAEQARQFNLNLEFDNLKYWEDLGLSKKEAKTKRDAYLLDVDKFGQANADTKWANENMTAYQKAQTDIAQQNANTSEKKANEDTINW